MKSFHYLKLLIFNHLSKFAGPFLMCFTKSIQFELPVMPNNTPDQDHLVLSSYMPCTPDITKIHF